MQQKSIKKNMVMNMILTVSNFVFPLITYSYVARILTPTGTGKVAFVDSILAYFLYIATLGIPAYGRRETAKVREDKVKLSTLVQELFLFNIVSTIIAIIALIVTVASVPRLQEYTLLFVIMGSQILLKPIGFEWFYEGIEEYSYITIRSIICKAIAVLLTFLLIHSKEDVLWYGFVHIFTISASNILNFYNIRKYISLKKEYDYNFKRHIKPIIILFAASLAITIYANFDVSMLGFISTEHEVGLYNAAKKIKDIVIALSTAATGVLVPRMAYYFEKKEYKSVIELLSKSARVSFLLALPVAVYSIVEAENMLVFVAGSEYISAASTLRVLMLCVFALVATALCGAQLLIPMGKEKRYSQSVIVGLFINLILNWILIPKWGAVGAAIGTLATEIWNVIWMGSGCFDYVKKIISNISIFKYIITMLIAMAVTFLVNNVIQEMTIFFQLAISSIVFFGIYYFLMFIIKDPLISELIGKLRKKPRIDKQ